MGKATWTPLKIMNALNEKYDLIALEITSREEANEFWRVYFAPIATISPNFFDGIDADLGLAVIDNWSDKEGLNREALPLLVKSSIYKNRRINNEGT
jgi:hypothetical protein